MPRRRNAAVSTRQLRSSTSSGTSRVTGAKRSAPAAPAKPSTAVKRRRSARTRRAPTTTVPAIVLDSESDDGDGKHHDDDEDYAASLSDGSSDTSDASGEGDDGRGRATGGGSGSGSGSGKGSARSDMGDTNSAIAELGIPRFDAPPVPAFQPGTRSDLTFIHVRGAREHNLRNVDVDIPRDKLVCVAGVSGSGKSSLVHGVVYAEARRQLLETMSAFTRARMPPAPKPRADLVSNVSPAIVINQKRIGLSPRSTVGTVTEVFTFLRLLYSRAGKPSIGGSHRFSFNQPEGACPTCDGLGMEVDLDEHALLDKSRSLAEGAILHPDYSRQDGYLMHSMRLSGVLPWDKPVRDFTPKQLDTLLHSEKRMINVPGSTFRASFEGIATAIRRRHQNSQSSGHNAMIAAMVGANSSAGAADSFPSPASTNGKGKGKGKGRGKGIGKNPNSAPKKGKKGRAAVVKTEKPAGVKKERGTVGTGRTAAVSQFFVSKTCSDCRGQRLCADARAVTFASKTICELADMEIEHLLAFVTATKPDRLVAPIMVRLLERLQSLVNIGVGYLSLSRPTATLSGGESQRVKTAKQLNCSLVGLMYVLDEPSIGLHPRDIDRQIQVLQGLRDKGNHVLVVEHEASVIRAADHIIEIGPAAGASGGHLVFQGTPAEIMSAETKTGTGAALCEVATKAKGRARRPHAGYLEVKNVNLHNVKDLSVNFPKGVLCCVTGVAGSGKSTITFQGLVRQHPDIITMDQSALSRSNRSTPATYTGAWTHVRELFSASTGKKAALFSFNSVGQCPECSGHGVVKVDMAYLEAVAIECKECKGLRFRDDVLALSHAGKRISDIMSMTVDEALAFFKSSRGSKGHESRARKAVKCLQPLQDVGLGYLVIGQPVSTLSGGEAQRIKIGSELKNTASTYVFDEPTTGLANSDVRQLVTVFDRLVDAGNTVVVITHSLELIVQADWLIDMGPDAGAGGGRVVAAGTPEDVARAPLSHTGRFLAQRLIV